MERETVLLAMIHAVKDKKMWVLSRQNIVVDCSESWLDFSELTRKEFIYTDIINDPLDWIIKGRGKAGLHSSSYEMEIVGNITRASKRVMVVPHIFDSYRFTIFNPLPVPVLDFRSHHNILESNT